MQLNRQAHRRLVNRLPGLGGPDATRVDPTVTRVKEDRAVIVAVRRAERYTRPGSHVRRERLGTGWASPLKRSQRIAQLR